MYYDFNSLFEVLPGIIWSDRHHEINQQMLMKRYGEFTIKRGTPLAMYVPYERNKYSYDISGPNQKNSEWANVFNLIEIFITKSQIRKIKRFWMWFKGNFISPIQ